MALRPVAGCRFYIGTVLDEKSTDFTATDFTSITWTEVSKWKMMGDVGEQASLITDDLINENYTKKSKGTYNSGSMANVFATDPLDPGQVALIAAAKSPNNFAFKIELNDKPIVGTSPKNSLRYFIGLVMGTPESGGSANTNRNLNATIEINSNIVRVAASAT